MNLARATHPHQVGEIGDLLAVGSEILGASDGLAFRNQANLIVVAFDAEQSILKATNESSEVLGMSLYRTIPLLHPSGSIAFTGPRPWLMQGHRTKGMRVFCTKSDR